MTGTTRRCRNTCVHEAGHAFVRWYFGFETDRAVVLTDKEVRSGTRIRNREGYLITCLGMVSGPAILDWPCSPGVATPHAGAQPANDRWLAYRRDVELILLYAGFHAHAHRARIHPNAAALWGGRSDLAHFVFIQEAWAPQQDDGASEALEARIAAWTRALVRSRQAAMAIQAIAAALEASGRLSGSRIAALCRQAYGGRQCDFEAWADLWPPKVEQLRAGFIPEAQAKAVARGGSCGDARHR